MTETNDGSKLVGKLVEIMGELERVPKRGHNNFQNYDYVMEADVEEAFSRACVKRNVMVFPHVNNMEIKEPIEKSNQRLTTVLISWTFEDADTGEQRTVTMAGQGSDPGDKGIYKAFTGANKYMILKTFHLATGDDPEADERVDKEAGELAAKAVAERKTAEANWQKREAEGMAKLNEKNTMGLQRATPDAALSDTLKQSIANAERAYFNNQPNLPIIPGTSGFPSQPKARINTPPPPREMKREIGERTDDGAYPILGLLTQSKIMKSKDKNVTFLACKVETLDGVVEFSVFDNHVYPSGFKLFDLIARAQGKPCHFVVRDSYKKNKQGKPYINLESIKSLAGVEIDENGPVIQRGAPPPRAEIPEDFVL
jgi:hypothetical protein